MQVKTSSFLDWELSFRGLKPNIINEKYTYKKKDVNSLGISDTKFKDFMKTWKEKNL